MSNPRLTLPAVLACCAAAALALAPAQGTRAQDKAPPGERLQPAREFDRQSEKSFLALIQADDPKLGARETDLIDLAAQHYAYRLTWTELHGATGGMSKVVGDVEYLLLQFQSFAKKGARNEAVRQRFLQQLAERLKEVMANPHLIARVNGARMMALVAENGHEGAADPLAEVAGDDKQNDAVRYYALQGLRKLLEQAQQPGGTPLKNREREANAVLAALKVVERKLPAGLPPEQKEGARLFRREALRVLSQTRAPALVDAKAKQVRARPAVNLLRVMALPEGVSPEARMDEQVEAAVGLARAQSRLAPDYQPDYAAQHLGSLVVRMAERYQKEGKETTEPWRVHAARLGEALEAMRQDTAKLKDKDAARYVEEVAKRAAPVLAAMEAGRTANASNLFTWLTANPSKSTTLFRDVPESGVQPMDPSELKTGEKPPAEKKPEEKKP